jgi:hypothetical protein
VSTVGPISVWASRPRAVDAAEYETAPANAEAAPNLNFRRTKAVPG